MPSTRRSARRQKHELHNQHQPIFKLPPEVLSTIFVFASQYWGWEFDNESCQGVIPAVCRLWRKVALETTALWTRVGIADHPVTYHRSKLHLSRCGSVAPLELMIDMVGSDWDQLAEGKEEEEECVQRVNAIFSLITHGGGATSRWKRCSIQTTNFHAHLAILRFLESSDFPSLEYLELIYTERAGAWDLEQVGISNILESAPRPLFRSTPPRLKTIRLLGIPSPYVFGHTADPQFTGLTHLQLALITQEHQLRHLNGLLAASPQLIALSLCSVSIHEGSAVEPFKFGKEVAPSPFDAVRLHNLRSLAFTDIDSALWVLGVLMMLDAPNVKALHFSYSNDDTGGADYRRFLRFLIWSAEERTKDSCLYFPKLTHLSYDLESGQGTTADLKLVLSEYTTLESLEIPVEYLGPVLNRPKPCWMVPNLKRLRISITRKIKNVLAEVTKTVEARRKAGMVLDHVEVLSAVPIPDTQSTINHKKKLKQSVNCNLIITEHKEQLEDLMW